MKYITGVQWTAIMLLGLLTMASAAAQNPPAQRGVSGSRGTRAPKFNAATTKLFGANQEFTADVTIMSTDQQKPVTVPGKMSFLHGKSRFEMDLTQLAGPSTQEGGVNQMKQMGLDRVIHITLPEKKELITVYPSLQSYVQNTLTAADSRPEADFQLTTKELDRVTFDDHPCVREQVTVTDGQGQRSESTVWAATDLNMFPIKIEQSQDGGLVGMTFKNIKLQKPPETDFAPPKDYTRYDNMQAMMRQVMMKRFGQSQRTPFGKPGS